MDRNLLIGFGETLTGEVKRKSGGGPKAYPYSFEEARERLEPQLEKMRGEMMEVDEAATADRRLVGKFTLHPAFYAKSYFPESCFSAASLRTIGSKGTHLIPEKVAIKYYNGEPLATTTIFVSGTVEAFNAFNDLYSAVNLNDTQQDELRRFENIEFFDANDKIKSLPEDDDVQAFEVVLQGADLMPKLLESFTSYATSLECRIDTDRLLISGGLIFVPVRANKTSAVELAKYTHLRVLRKMPDLRIYEPSIFRERSAYTPPELPEGSAINTDVKVAVFDGGLGVDDFSQWCTEKVFSNAPTRAGYLSHGQEVTSAILFGQLQPNQPHLPPALCNIDHYRVIDSGNHSDVDLFDALRRIKLALEEGSYDFANLSLGPRLPIDDDDIHAWTAIIDQLIADTGTLITIAVGNDGDAELKDDTRIQPPADSVNGLGIGSTNVTTDDWVRAPYSCVGPGRSPGIVKPDGLFFGGSEDQPLLLLSPSHGVVETAGTSFASPLTLRAAIEAFGSIDTSISPLATKALLIHGAMPNKQPKPEIGWGRFPTDIDDILYCGEGEATVMYQGALMPGKRLRAALPYPDIPLNGKVEVTATFCFFSDLDSEHSGNYTQSGLEIVFRTDVDDPSKTMSFFKKNNQFETEQEARDDAHKWETTLKANHRFQNTTLNDPCFDITYFTREKSSAASGKQLPLKYTLIVSIKQPQTPELYSNVLQRYQTLQPIRLKQQIRINN